jgi:predicted aspartyl protease
LGSPCVPYYLTGAFSDIEVPILLDTGSAVTVIDEELWSLLNTRKESLEKVSFPIRSATHHNVDIIGQREMTLQLCTKRKKSVRKFTLKVIVAKGLIHKAIIGMDFLKKFGAVIDLYNKRLFLYIDGTKSTHDLKQGTPEYRTVNVILKQNVLIE